MSRAGCERRCGVVRWGLGEEFAELSMQRIEPDIFDGLIVPMIDIELAASLSLSDVHPVGCFVTGAAEAIGLHEGLQQHGAITVALLPIGGQLTCDAAEDFRSEALGLDPG